MQTLETPARIVLDSHDLRQLRTLRKHAEHARKEGELAVTRARLAILESDRALVQYFEQLAAQYDFDPDAAWQLDEAAGALVPGRAASG